MNLKWCSVGNLICFSSLFLANFGWHWMRVPKTDRGPFILMKISGWLKGKNDEHPMVKMAGTQILHQKIHRAIATKGEPAENKMNSAPCSHHHHLSGYFPHPLVFKTPQLKQLLFMQAFNKYRYASIGNCCDSWSSHHSIILINCLSAPGSLFSHKWPTVGHPGSYTKHDEHRGYMS